VQGLTLGQRINNCTSREGRGAQQCVSLPIHLK
jgi:hypothetical protein